MEINTLKKISENVSGKKLKDNECRSSTKRF